jgi:hypothetical protein
MATARDAVGADVIAAALASRRGELIAAALDTIQSRMAAYRQADPGLLEDVRRHIGAHHDLLCGVLRRGRPAAPREFQFVRRHAALRARRAISLPDFLEAFRAYHNVVWDAVLAASQGSREAGEQALGAARTVIRHIDLATTEASAAYLEAQQLLLAEGDRVRRDLLEDLLAGRAPRTAAGLTAARAAGLDGAWWWSTAGSGSVSAACCSNSWPSVRARRGSRASRPSSWRTTTMRSGYWNGWATPRAVSRGPSSVSTWRSRSVAEPVGPCASCCAQPPQV